MIADICITADRKPVLKERDEDANASRREIG